ncbi:hypothetical protein K1T71_014977 [Dendrolimus kikuchii]|nr:hypothetical protein K1T71_014977 [Dendrolimus kikuchii]
MPQCSAYGCKNRESHAFPKDPKRRKLWEKALRRKNWKSTDVSKLCCNFKPVDYYGISAHTRIAPMAKFLKRTVVPNVFVYSKSKNPKPNERETRLENRNRRKLFMPIEREIPTSTCCIEENINKENNLSSQSIIINPVNVYIYKHVYGSIKRFMYDDNAIAFYTGFESYKKFYFVFSTLSPMAHKIHNSLSISPTTVSYIFIIFINFVHQLWQRLNIWPDKDLVQYFTPESFKKYNLNTQVILDGTEIKVQKPQNPLSQQASWSSYKHANTLKVLVGATPGGLLSYDRQMVERSDLTHKCEPGDSILADRGFNIQDLFAGRDITIFYLFFLDSNTCLLHKYIFLKCETKIVHLRVNIPPSFLKGKSQIPGLTVLQDRKLASKKVHIERLIGLIKTYKILRNELHHSYIPLSV